MSSLKSILNTAKNNVNPPKERYFITLDDVSLDFPFVFDGNGKMNFFEQEHYVFTKRIRYTKVDKKNRQFMLIYHNRKGLLMGGEFTSLHNITIFK